MSRERCCVGAQVTDLCRNVCDSYGDAQPSTAAGGDRGDNTARRDDPTLWGPPCNCGALVGPHRHGVGSGAGWASGLTAPVPAADRQTDEERCVGCALAGAGLHRLGCPVRTAAERAARPAVADAVMADPGAAITEGVTEVRLREERCGAVPNLNGPACIEDRGHSGDVHRTAVGTTWPVARGPRLATVGDRCPDIGYQAEDQ